MINDKSEGIAVILSFFICGLGQMYVGKIIRGFGFLIAFIVGSVLFALTFFLGIIALVVWIYGMYDAYQLARQYNEYVCQYQKKPW